MVSFLEPEKIMNQIPLEDYFLVADFGSGSGGFTIPIASRVPRGLVYAFDIQEDSLSALKGDASLSGLSNIKVAKCNLEEPNSTGIPDGSLDLVMIANTLFQMDHDEAVMKEAARIIKPGGKVIVIDWKTYVPFGPDNKRISLEEVRSIARRIDLKLFQEIDAGTYHWGAIFVK